MIEALADRIRMLLRTQLVCVFMRQDGPFELRGVAAEIRNSPTGSSSA